MKQILQNLKTGELFLEEVVCPQLKLKHLLIQTTRSLISAGTERMLVNFGRAGYISKAKQQPEKVRQVLDKVKTDGLLPTINAIRSKLEQPLPLGYCNVGIVLEEEVKKSRRAEEQNLPSHPLNFLTSVFKAGDRVLSNGPHAEVVCVPRNLCARIPDEVSDEEAVFTVIGAVGLQGVRLAQPTLGEFFVVTGLGLIGLLTVQILRANGCKVLGIDIDSGKCSLAKQFGAEIVDLSKGEDQVDAAMAFSQGRGVDGVLITAATKSSEPVHQAAQMCRKRGRIVLVGVTGLELHRADFYEKELSFQVSCSYGPGRYDLEYEEKGHDYPIGFVRWTEQRNFEAILNLMATGKLDVRPLISHKFPFEEAEKAYQLIAENREPYLGIILKYGAEEQKSRRAEGEKGRREGEEEVKKVRSLEDERTLQLRSVEAKQALHSSDQQQVVVGLIGAGNFTRRILLPALQKTGARFKTIASSGGITGTHLGKKFGFEQNTTDVEQIFADPEINTIFITTRHNTHARFVLQALEAGKHVFVEKPLCINEKQLHQIIETYSEIRNPKSEIPLLMVGFNRRFAPHVAKVKELLEAVKEPGSFIMTVNAGMIPANHWTQDPEVGGGRIIGEACHFIDLLRSLTGSEIVNSGIVRLQTGVGDTVSIQLAFADGSIGTIHYFANGNKRFPKERLEVFCGGKILQLDNFKVMRGYGWKGFKKMKLWRQDKGHAAEMKAFLEEIEKGGPAPIPFDEIMEVTRVMLELAKN